MKQLSSICFLLFFLITTLTSANRLTRRNSSRYSTVWESVSDSNSVEALHKIKTFNIQTSVKEFEETILENLNSLYKSEVSFMLTDLLRENHEVYRGKSPTEVSQMRGFLLVKLGSLPASTGLSKYVQYELNFASHPFNIAAAVVAARQLPELAPEILPLLENYLAPSFNDSWVDITTTQLRYPIKNSTKVRYEVIETLKSFGFRARPLLGRLNEIASCYNCYRDSLLMEMAKAAAESISVHSPDCCNSKTQVLAPRTPLLIPKNLRETIRFGEFELQDQEEHSLTFSDLKGTPFVLSFFYTRCANPLKCAATAGKLGKLQSELKAENVGDKIRICGLTYDPEFDSPLRLKRFGESYGIDFDDQTSFFRTMSLGAADFHQALKVRVNYGYGGVNQHGTQLYVFDKKARLAAVFDEEDWSVELVKGCLIKLLRE